MTLAHVKAVARSGLPCVFFTAYLAMALGSALAADTRLGLVPLGGRTDDLADLLTAELSKL